MHLNDLRHNLAVARQRAPGARDRALVMADECGDVWGRVSMDLMTRRIPFVEA
ncbi:MAG: hypothetical protein ABI858_12020 [Pseudoxanthomonas sp.]